MGPLEAVAVGEGGSQITEGLYDVGWISQSPCASVSSSVEPDIMTALSPRAVVRLKRDKCKSVWHSP